MTHPIGSGVRRVLLVEDDPPSREALRTVLEEEGFEVEVARDGAEGVELVHSFRPDVVILDLVMPGLSGFDAAHILKEDVETASIPLLAVTASWLGSANGRLEQIGFSGALRKPFPPAALVGEVRKILAH